MTELFTRRDGLALLACALVSSPPVACAPSNSPVGAANILDFLPGPLRAEVLAGTVTEDLTPYYRRAFAASSAVFFPAGTYTHVSFALLTGQTLTGSGPKTVFRQLPSAAAFDSLFLIEQSNVTLRNCTVEGIISLFAHDRPNQKYPIGRNNSEFNHGILIRSGGAGAPVRNISVEGLIGRNLRGDVIAIHCDRGATLDGVTIGDVYGENILRNGVSIVGGSGISIRSIDGSGFGYATFDIEPEGTYSAPVSGVTVGHVRGATIQIAADASSASDVRIDLLETDPSFAGNSSPPYRNAAGALQLDTSIGLRLRNARRVRIGRHVARGHASHAVGYVADTSPSRMRDPSLRIDAIDYAGIGAHEQQYFALVQASGLHEVVITGGTARMAHDNQRLLLGSLQGSGTRCAIENVRTDGMIAAYVRNSLFAGIRTVANAKRGFAIGIEDSVFVDCDVAAAYLGYNITRCMFERMTFSKLGGAYVFGGTSAGNRFESSDVAGRRIVRGAY